MLLVAAVHAAAEEPAAPLQAFPEFHYFEMSAPASPPVVVITTPPVQEPPPEEERVIGRPDPPEILGDQAPITILLPIQAGAFPQPGPDRILVPSPRYFKIADNESPEPRRRNYVSFNYFYDWGDSVNERLGTGIQRTRIHRETFGWEFADTDRSSSIGFRVPVQTYNAVHDIDGLNGTHTTFGDLAIIFKEVLWRAPKGGHLLSGGLAIVTPTGPSTFAGVENIEASHDVVLQPFVGFIRRWKNFYAQGFTAVDAPCNLNDVVVLNNDLAVGCFLYQGGRKGLNAIVPTVEVHVNTPLNHRGILDSTDRAGTPDMVHLTSGVHFEWCDRNSLGVGVVVPVVGPPLFDFEIVAQYRCRF